MRLRRLEPILRRALRGPCSTASGQRLLVAVSGGADSTALLLGLHRLARAFDLELHAAHLDHGLRGRESDRDRRFVATLCERLGVPLIAARWNTRLRMERRGLSGQAGLRALRREFLMRAARRSGCVAIATAHHADDQLETLLMRLLRGSGLVGLGGMAERRGIWLKPLLQATRADIAADLTDAGQAWCEDASNRDPAYTRNRIRDLAIPALMRAFDPDRDPAALASRVARHAARATAELRAAAGLLNGRIFSGRSGARRIQPGLNALDSSRLRSYPPLLRHAALKRAWSAVAPHHTGLTHRHLGSLDRLLTGGRGNAQVSLPGGYVARRDRRWVYMVRTDPGTIRDPVRLSVPGRVEWGGVEVKGTWTSGVHASSRLSRKSEVDEFFAADGLNGALELRTAEADERFVPFGRQRPTRLGRFLNKQRVSRDLKSRPRVLADAGGILWVLGVRRSARAPVTAGTSRVLWVHAERHD